MLPTAGPDDRTRVPCVVIGCLSAGWITAFTGRGNAHPTHGGGTDMCPLQFWRCERTALNALEEERSMLMNRTLLNLSLGLALLAGLGAPANAADVIYQNGMKDTISDVVPVPAPVPIPIYQPGYYFRLDAGLGFGDNPSASEQGLVYGRDRMAGTFGTERIGVIPDFDNFVTLGVGVAVPRRQFPRRPDGGDAHKGKVKISGDYQLLH